MSEKASRLDRYEGRGLNIIFMLFVITFGGILSVVLGLDVWNVNMFMNGNFIVGFVPSGLAGTLEQPL